MNNCLRTTILSIGLSVGASCATTDGRTTVGTTGTDTEGTASTNSDDADSDTTVGTDVCEEQPFDIARDAGRLMILMDLSDSMGLENRWIQAQQAVRQVLGKPGFADIEFGFDRFPDSECLATDLQIDCAPDNGGSISGMLSSYSPGGLTPLYCAMKNFVDSSYAPGCSAPGKPQYLLVVSDGQPSCSKKECIPDNWDHPAASDMGDVTDELLDAGIKTFVIGFDYQDSPDFLNTIASHGGTGVTEYISAGDDVELENAISEVAGSVVSCTFEIQAADPSSDPEKVNFYFDDNKKPIPRNDNCATGTGEGWTWTDDKHTHIQLCDPSCGSLEKGEVSTLHATFGCKTVVVVI